MNIYLYQKYNQYFAQHASGAEIAAKDELLYLGAKNIKLGYLGYFFEADNATIYKIVYCTRILSRVLAPIIDFKCHSEKYLYKTAQQINWEDFITLTKTFSIKTNVSNSNIKNSQYATQILKDCIVDQFKKKFNKRPNVDTRFPDLSLNLYIHENRARISLDLGGSSLHKRGYRKYTVDAPMKETLAATIIRLSEWDKTTPIYDPFCGSGTILFEAAMHYCEIPAAFLRSKFGFLRLPDFDNTLWNQTKSKINKHMQSLPKDLINGSDINHSAVNASKKNKDAFIEFKNISLIETSFQNIGDLKNKLIITNPPYGIRQNNEEEVGELLKQFGDFLKQSCTGSTAFIFFGNKTLAKKIGLKPDLKIPINAGALNGILCRYLLY